MAWTSLLPFSVTPYTGTLFPATRMSSLRWASALMCSEAQAVMMSKTPKALLASSSDIPEVWTPTITARSPHISRMASASPTKGVVTAILPNPMALAFSAPATMSILAVSGSSMFAAPTASTTAPMGSVSHIPDMRPPRPCTTFGSVRTAVPHPSAAMTTASISPLTRA